MAPEPQPVAVTIFSYQVGFGDCFLLRFEYDAAPSRHVLVDFGTTKLPTGAPANHMVRIARDISEKSGGHLEAVVATHRHADHISGFATNAAGTASGDIIRALNPEVVLQPWTEAPDADDASLGPVVSTGERSMGQKLRALDNMHGVAAKAVALLDAKAFGHAPTEVKEQIDFIGRDNIKNVSAVRNLMTMGPNIYSYHEGPSGLDDLLPGVSVTVLGPPTLAQTETIRKQRSRDPDEFWQLALQGIEADGNPERDGDMPTLFPGHPTFPASRLPMETMWFRDRLDEVRADQTLSIVRSLDDQMNNTSLILLFELGGKTLLFPGDAQIENWSYTLSKPEWRERLRAVDLYKVGHHGSLNATPRSMWELFDKKGDEDSPERLTSIMSTLPGKHGSEKSRTEVPRKTLLDALRSETDLHSTHLLPADKLCEEIRLVL